MPWGLILKIGLPVLLVLGLGLHLRNYNHTLQELGAAEEALQQCHAAVQSRDQALGNANQRIARNNERWLQRVQQENDRLLQAKREAVALREERDRVTAALSASRLEWREAIEHDEHLAEFVRHDVPAAVWRRLCVASGDPDCH